LLVVVAAVLARRISKSKLDRRRIRAAELRAQADATHSGIKQKQAEADETAARAREVRAEADRKQAEAKKLEAQASDKRSTLSEHVQRRDELLDEADRLDPDTTEAEHKKAV
jgi:uncharacterized coiled-coil DUF342 family protein